MHGGARKHYIAIGVAFITLATLGALGLSPDVRHILLNVFMGFGLIVGGIGDHLVLRQALRPCANRYAETV